MHASIHTHMNAYMSITLYLNIHMCGRMCVCARLHTLQTCRVCTALYIHIVLVLNLANQVNYVTFMQSLYSFCGNDVVSEILCGNFMFLYPEQVFVIFI